LAKKKIQKCLKRKRAMLAGRRRQTRDGEQHAFQAPAQPNAPLNSDHSLKLLLGEEAEASPSIANTLWRV